MSRMQTRAFWLAAAWALVMPRVASAQADAPALLPVQGYVADKDGAALEGEFNLQLTLYVVENPSEPEDAAQVLYREVHLDQPLSDGFFTAYLGSGNPLSPTEGEVFDLSSFLAEPMVYLGVKVGTDPEARPLLRMATAPYAGFAQYCGDAETLRGKSSDAFADAAHSHDWRDIASSIPRGLADGDDDTTYSAAATGGLSLSGTAFSIANRGVTTARLEDGAVTRAKLERGAVGTDQLDARAVTVAKIDSSSVQARVSEACPAGSAIREITAAGDVVCESDSTGSGDITEIVTREGSGLTGGCATGACRLSVDPTGFNGAEPASSSYVAGRVLPCRPGRPCPIGTFPIPLGSAANESVTLTNTTVDVGGPGHVLVVGSATCYGAGLEASGGQDWTAGVIGTDDDEQGSPDSPSSVYFQLGRNAAGSGTVVNPRGASVSVSRVYPVESAGEHRFYLRGHVARADTVVTCDDVSLSAMFVAN